MNLDNRKLAVSHEILLATHRWFRFGIVAMISRHKNHASASNLRMLRGHLDTNSPEMPQQKVILNYAAALL